MNRISSYSEQFVTPDLQFHVLHDVDLRKTVGLSRCPVARSAEDVAAVFENLAHIDDDTLISCALDDKLRIVRWSALAFGREQFSRVRPIDALIGAIRSRAKRIILVENRTDESVRLNGGDFISDVDEAARQLGYILLDHVIIENDGTFLSRRIQSESRPPAARIVRLKEKCNE